MGRGRSKSNPIALVGMWCAFPGALSPEELWENVLAGRRYFRKTPACRMAPDYFDPDPAAPGKSYADQMAVITGWSFDPLAYRIPPVTFNATDLAHWLALDTARRAVEEARLDLRKLDRTRMGVVLGNSLTGEFSRSHNLRFRWPYVERSIRRALHHSHDHAAADAVVASVKEIFNAPFPAITEDTLAGNMSNTIAGRVCNYFDLGAGGYTVDGACSSSLLAIATACNALRNGDMDIALAGGVDVSLDPFEIVGFAKTQALAKEDIRPYDERAAGMLTGEGCGIFILTRADTAKSLGLKPLAYIRGWGYSSDGAGGMTAPEIEGQARALRNAYALAGYPMSSVGLIEGHGTGTALGDKVEISAIQRLLEGAKLKAPCRIGSIKGNIGHCKAAAGSAGLAKAVMAVARKSMPPTMNCDRPNSLFGAPAVLLVPNVKGRPWGRSPTPRRASVSAMGFGGSNCHVTIEEAVRGGRPTRSDLAKLGSARKSEIVPISAPNREEAAEQAERIASLADKLSRAELTDLSAALTSRPLEGAIRLAVVARSPWHLAETLRAAADALRSSAPLSSCGDSAAGLFVGEALADPTMAMLFPGQGSQRVNMCAHLLDAYPFVRKTFKKFDKAVSRQLHDCLSDEIFRDDQFASDATRAAWGERLRNTSISQPAVVASSLAMLSVLDHYGLKPSIVIGHSLGEITSLAAGRLLSPEVAVKVAASRGAAMSSLHIPDPGAMMAVAASAAEVEELVASVGGPIAISNFNSPSQTVVSGPTAAIDRFAAACARKDVQCKKLNVSHAFHSEIVAPASASFLESLAKVKFRRRARSQIVSTATGGLLEKGADVRHLLGDQIRQPVRFIEAVETAKTLSPSLWVEVGPGGVLSGLVREILAADGVEPMPTDLPGDDGHDLLHRILSRAFVLGFPVALEKLFAWRFHRPIDVETYNPVMIVNPCEREPGEAVFGALQRHVGGESAAISSELAPEGMDAAAFAAYLERRGGFLRDMIAADQRHLQGAPAKAPVAAPAAVVSATSAAAQPGEALPIIDFAIDWISQRTGFPKTAILPDMKLRDDLNLDSIKVGELVFSICRKLDKKTPPDPSAFANSTLERLVALAQSDFQDSSTRAAGSPDSTTVLGMRAAVESPAADWVKVFQIERREAPIDSEGQLHLPNRGSVLIVGEPHSPRVEAVRSVFVRKGLSVRITDVAVAPEAAIAEDLSFLIIILPEMEKRFLDCSPGEFDAMLEARAGLFFSLFQKIAADRDASWKNLRCLTLRPSSGGPDAELDAGKAFLKTMRLEHSAFHAKWIVIPSSWEPERWASVAEAEAQTRGGRVGYFYTPEGLRMTDMGASLPPPTGKELSLTTRDVVLVTGGAKGITFELAFALAKRTNARIALLGTSPAPQGKDGDDEMSVNFRRLEEAKITYQYEQCDVTELESVRGAVDNVRSSLGEVTMILHGAGISQLFLLQDMKRESFMKTIRVKAGGLYHLLKVVPPLQLTALHVVSSVLGKTGMRGQADYTFANAWLDGALELAKAENPMLHCLSLGYSVWADVGLGMKLGAVDSLRHAGVTPMDAKTGIDSYLRLLDLGLKESVFIITGRLGPEIEQNLYTPPDAGGKRFLGRILRWAPGAELLAESTLSHSTDLYLPEHVYGGTPVFPGVLGLEAMAQAASLCALGLPLAAIEDIVFEKPLIIPEDAVVSIRTHAVADNRGVVADGALRVKVSLFAETDGFRQAHFSALCVFAAETSAKAADIEFPRERRSLGMNPEELSPTPLFQGKFLRRIADIHLMAKGDDCVTEVEIPDGERYFEDRMGHVVVTGSPVARDSYLQSGLLILPAGSLPARIERVAFGRCVKPGEKVLCRVKVRRKLSDTEFVSDLAVFDREGEVLEAMTGVLTRTPKAGHKESVRRAAAPLAMGRLCDDLGVLLPDSPHALAIVAHADCSLAKPPAELSAAEFERLAADTPAPRRASVVGNLAAVRRAAHALAAAHKLELPADKVALTHDTQGKPHLDLPKELLKSELFSELDVSLADGADCSIAFIGRDPVGVDIELVAPRSAETWRALLGDDGYALAVKTAVDSAESFDTAATRVWTLIEAGKKAASLQRIIPTPTSSLGGPWLGFAHLDKGVLLEYLSTVVRQGAAIAAATVVLRSKAAPETLIRTPSLTPAVEFEKVLTDFRKKMLQFRPEFKDDPDNAGTEEHHQRFLAEIEALMAALLRIERKVDTPIIYGMRKRLLDMVLEFLDGSDVFRHAIEKPFGYAGDFLMLDKLVQNQSFSTGLAYHFDRSQLEYPASVACRNRISWVGHELAAFVKARGGAPLKILDIGCGAAPIERYLMRTFPDITLDLIAVDIEPACLEFVEKTVRNQRNTVKVARVDLRLADSTELIAGFAKDRDVCVAVGIIEALRDEEMIRLFKTLFTSLPKGVPLYTESFLPSHPSRPHMEWFMDFHLGYRSRERVRELVELSGAKPSKIESSVDATNSLGFLKIST